MNTNICYKFGTPHSLDLQELQNICLNINSSNIAIQKFLLILFVALIIFLSLVFFVKAITTNEDTIKAYYKASFTYFIQLFTVIAVIPIIVYFFQQEINIIGKIITTFFVLGIIFLMYEYWPIYKKEANANSSIISTILVTIFTISFYHSFTLGFKDDNFVQTSLIAIATLSLIIFNIFITFIKEIKKNPPKKDPILSLEFLE